MPKKAVGKTMKKIHVLMFLILISMSICLFGTMTAKAAGPFDHLGMTGYPSVVDVGQSFGGVTVTAYDASDNIVSSYSDPVYFMSSDTQATLPYTSLSPYTFVSTDAGTHTFSGFIFKTVGSQTLAVNDVIPGISLQSNPITVNSALIAPTVTAAPSTIDQGQTCNLTSSPVTTGTSPYTYQWFQKDPAGTYSKVGINSASYSFASAVSTAAGLYNFMLQVTDTAGCSCKFNSNCRNT